MGKATAKEAEHHQLEAESLVEAAREREYNHEGTIPHHPRHLRRVGDTGDGTVRSRAMTDRELIVKIRENDRALLELLVCSAPTADGALMGYEGELCTLELDGDELLEECDRRGLDRQAALLGVIKRLRPARLQA